MNVNKNNMIKKFRSTAYWLFFATSAVLIPACSNDSPQEGSSGSEGRIQLTIVTDHNVAMGTRGEDDPNYAIKPEVDEFFIKLLSKDGSVDRIWNSLDKFNNEDGFPMGMYTLSVFYGNSDIEGFENPYYYGEEEIEVMLGHTTVQTVTASLANSMLSVRYSDDLKAMFRSYSSAIQTDGHSLLTFEKDEERPAYVSSGQARFFVTLTNDKEETVTVNLMDLNMRPKHHYIVTVGVNKDGKGTAILDVKITEDITIEDPIEIKLTDEFFSAPLPVITPIGFSPDKTLEFFETFAELDNQTQIQVMALAGLKSVKLNLSAEDGGLIPVWGSSNETIELVTSDADTKNKLSQGGMDCHGFFDNAKEFGFIDFTNYIENLPAGLYKASITVQDILGRSADISLPEVVLKTKVNPVLYKIAGFLNPDFLDEKIYIAVSTNCEKIKESFTFSANNEDGGITGVEFSLLQENPGITVLDSEFGNTYFYELKVDEINDNQWTVYVNHNNKEEGLLLDVNMPDFTVETDAFAKRVYIKINAESKEKSVALAKVVNIKNNGNLIKSENIIRDYASQGIIVVKGLNSKNQIVDGVAFNGEYNAMNLFLGKKENRSQDDYPGIPYKGTPFSFVTEEAKDVPNGDFELLETKYTGSGVVRGGDYTVTLVSDTYTNTADYEIKEPSGWITTNSITMNGKSYHDSSDNTWYNQPSVFNSTLTYKSTVPLVRFWGWTYFDGATITPPSYDNFNPRPLSTGVNAMVVRNVGWAPLTGKLSKDTDSSKADPNYFNRNFPSSYNVTGGKLYLDNIGFPSRPSKLTGYYKYTNDSNDWDEKGIIEIRIIDASNNILASGNFECESKGEYEQFSIDLNYDINNHNKASKIYLMVKSSNNPNESEIKVTQLNTQYETYYLGAYLEVDDFELVYE